jgi:hypothetical protein
MGAHPEFKTSAVLAKRHKVDLGRTRWLVSTYASRVRVRA